MQLCPWCRTENSTETDGSPYRTAPHEGPLTCEACSGPLRAPPGDDPGPPPPPQARKLPWFTDPDAAHKRKQALGLLILGGGLGIQALALGWRIADGGVPAPHAVIGIGIGGAIFMMFIIAVCLIAGSRLAWKGAGERQRILEYGQSVVGGSSLL